MGDPVAAAPLLGQLASARVPLRVIGSPNATSMLVISRPAVVFEATSPTNRRTNEPAILGVAVGAYVDGLAAPRVPTAVQVVA